MEEVQVSSGAKLVAEEILCRNSRCRDSCRRELKWAFAKNLLFALVGKPFVCFSRYDLHHRFSGELKGLAK